MKKKFLSVILTVAMLASLACLFPVSVSAENNDSWTYVDFSKVTYFQGTNANKVGTWTSSEDDGDQVLTLSGTTATNNGFYDNANSLKKGKAYEISVDMKFSKPYYSSGTTADNNASAAGALVFGIDGVNSTVTPWNTSAGATCFAAMYQRSNTKADNNILRIFQMASPKGDVQGDTQVGTDATETAKNSTDWINVSVRVSENGNIALYFNGALVSSSDQSAYWKGGYLGVVTSGPKTTDPISFKDLKYRCIGDGTAESDNNIAAAYWTDVDMSDMPVTALSGTWNYKNGILSATGAKGNNVNMTDIKLDADKAYTIELKARFAEGYVDDTDSKGFGLVFNSKSSASSSAWGSNDRYCAMIDRNASGASQASIFGGGGLTNSVTRGKGNQLTTAEKASTDWFTVRITIDERGEICVYYNGQAAGVHAALNAGGYIGLIAYNAATTVEFKDFRFTEGIVDESKLDYTGTSVRIDDKSGIRIKSAISDTLMNATVEDDGFKVVEYGTLVAKADSFASTAMTVGAEGVGKAVAFDESTDTFFEKKDGYTFYTVVLHNITNINQRYAFRGYYIVEYENGDRETFYQTYNGSCNLVKSLKGVAQQIVVDPNATVDELAYANKILGN